MNKKKFLSCMMLCVLSSLLLVGCNKGNSEGVQNGVPVENHEQSKLEQSGEIVEESPQTEESGSESKGDAIVPVYEGNYFENPFLGIKFRYPENWFSTDNYDVVLNTMKDLGLNDKLDLTQVKLKSMLPIVTFSCNDSYNNTIDILVTPSLDKLVEKEDLEPVVTLDKNGVVEENKEKEEESKKADVKDTSSENKNEAPKTENNVTPFSADDLAKIKKNIAESQTASGFTVVSTDEPYVEKYGNFEVANVETISQVYGDDYQLLTSFIDIGENYLMIISCSSNEPNEVDKVANLEDLVSTLKLGEDVSKNEEEVKNSDEDEVVGEESKDTTVSEEPKADTDTEETSKETKTEENAVTSNN